MAMKGLPHMGQWSNLYGTRRLYNQRILYMDFSGLIR